MNKILLHSIVLILIGTLCPNIVLGQSIVFNNVFNDFSYLKEDMNTNEIFYNNEYLHSISENEEGTYTLYGTAANNNFFIWEDSIYVYNYLVDIDEFGDSISTTRINLTTNDNRESTINAIKVGGYEYIIGMTNNLDLDYFDNINAKIIKLDNNRDTVWNRVFNMGADNKFVTIKTNNNGETFQVLGFADVDTGGINYDAFISTIDSSGALVSNIQLGGSENDFLYGLEYLANGNYLVCGHTYSLGVGGADIWLLEVDASGTIIWEKTFGTQYGDRIWNARGLMVHDNHIYIAGRTGKIFPDIASFAVVAGYFIKTDMQGNLVWEKQYARGVNNEEFISLSLWDDESFIIAAKTSTYNGTFVNPTGWVVKMDTAGNIIWDKEITKYKDIDAHHYVADGLVTQDGGILIGGYIIANSIVDINGYFHRNDAWLAKTDSCGFTAGDIPEPMLLIDSMLGNTIYISDHSQNYCTAELDWGDGTELQTYYAYENNLPLAVKHFSHTYTNGGMHTIKTTTLAGEEFRDYEVELLALSVSESAKLAHTEISLFPNPADEFIIVQNRNTNVQVFNKGGNNGLVMRIRTLSGKQVKNINLNPKLYQQQIDVSRLKNGVYFVHFEIDGVLITTEKMVVAR